MEEYNGVNAFCFVWPPRSHDGHIFALSVSVVEISAISESLMDERGSGLDIAMLAN